MQNKNYFKKISLAFLVILGITNGVHAQVPSYVPADGLVVYYPFNGNANDASGNGKNGTVKGATLAADRFGNANSAYSFDGTSSYIYAGNISSLTGTSTSSTTVSLWINSNSSSDANSDIFDLRSTNNSQMSMTVNYPTSGKIKGSYYDPNASIGLSAENANPLQINQWYHVVYVLNNSTGKLILYINGIEIGTAIGAVKLLNNPKLNIGSRFDTYNSRCCYFKGAIDDVYFWNRALTANEITALYQGCSKPTVTPLTAAIKTGENVTFTTPASANTTYQWQTNPANVGWQNLSDNTTYSGTTTNALTLTNGQAHNNGQSFRVTANATGCNETSEPVTVTISDVCTNYTTVTDLLVINVGTLSTNTPSYKSTITIYPNPAKDQITIDCGTLANVTGYQIKIVNTLGQEVYKTSLNQQQFTIPLNSWTGKGLYFVNLYDNDNVLITTRKIELQ